MSLHASAEDLPSRSATSRATSRAATLAASIALLLMVGSATVAPLVGCSSAPAQKERGGPVATVPTVSEAPEPEIGANGTLGKSAAPSPGTSGQPAEAPDRSPLPPPAPAERYGTRPPQIPSRAEDTLPSGHYFQAAGLSDDYPEETTSLERIRSDLRILRLLGARYYRVGIGWDGIETQRGVHDWRHWDWLVDEAWRAGITLLPYVCYTPAWAATDKRADRYWRSPPARTEDYARFMETIVRRYRGKIRSWELWNEPDLDNYWLGDAATFTRMIEQASAAVKAADPAAKIVLGGMARPEGEFLAAVLRSPRLLSALDAVNVHGYFETWYPETAESYPWMLREVAALIGKLTPLPAPGASPANPPGAPPGGEPPARHAYPADLWLAEFGYSSTRFSPDRVSEGGIQPAFAYEHTPAYQAAALWKHHLLASSSEAVSLTTWYRIHDLPAGEQVIGDLNSRSLGVLDAEGRPKPAFAAFRLHQTLFDQPYRLVSASIPRGDPLIEPNAVSVVFERLDGSLVVSAWLRSIKGEETNIRTGLAPDPRAETVAIDLPGSAAQWGGLEAYDLAGHEKGSPARLADGEITGIRLEGDSVFIGIVRRAMPALVSSVTSRSSRR